jgi:hypothetical protein
MKPLHRGLAVAALHCLIVLSLAGKYAIDRQRLPRVWVQTAPVYPNLPLRGRYVRLRLAVDFQSDTADYYQLARLSVVDRRLLAKPDPNGSVRVTHVAQQPFWTLAEPAAFFIPERVPDPSRRVPGEDLWVEVSVPGAGPPRPIRLGVKKDGVLTPLELR